MSKWPFYAGVVNLTNYVCHYYIFQCYLIINYTFSLLLKLQKIKELINNQQIRDIDAVRLVMLYALHYEKYTNNDINGLLNLLKSRAVSEKYIKVYKNYFDLTFDNFDIVDKFQD